MDKIKCINIEVATSDTLSSLHSNLNREFITLIEFQLNTFDKQINYTIHDTVLHSNDITSLLTGPKDRLLPNILD